MGAGHSHNHDHGGAWNFPLNEVGRVLAAITAMCAVVTVVAVIALWPGDDTLGTEDLFGTNIDYTDAEVIGLSEKVCFGFDENSDVLCDVIEFAIQSGPRDGITWNAEFTQNSPGTPDFAIGDSVVLGYQPNVPDERFQFAFIDFERKTPLYVLAVIFAVAIVLLGRFTGVRALFSLAASLVILVAFILPSILDGNNPVAVALAGSALVALIALYLTHGFNHLTTVALLGSFASLCLTGLLAYLFIRMSNITGLADENVAFLQVANRNVDVRGLLLAGFVIGTLGVLDDVTVTQASAVSEVHKADPTCGFSKLYAAGIRIGRSHIASTTNTLVLAYAGAALPLLLLFVRSGQPFGQVINSELVATEIVRTLVGTIGLIAAVPMTTALAAVIVRFEHDEDHSHSHANHDDPSAHDHDHSHRNHSDEDHSHKDHGDEADQGHQVQRTAADEVAPPAEPHPEIEWDKRRR